MQEQYRSVMRPAQIEIEEKKSRFIASCRPVQSEAEAQAFLQQEKSAYADASHHVYAWIAGKPYMTQRYSDDGEPQGTAGLPVLESLRQRTLEQAAVVVTRYFGGTLLGTGGLSRAYGKAASMAVEAACPVTYHLCRQFTVTAGYADMERLRHAWQSEAWWAGAPVFGLDVDIPVAVPAEKIDYFWQLCADLTGGAALLEAGGLIYRPLPPPDPPPDRQDKPG